VRRTIIWIFLAAAILAPAAAVALWWRDYEARQVRTHTVDAGNVLAGVTVSGTVRSRQQEAVAAEVIGAVKAILAKEGQAVTEGQVLIQLDDSVVAAEIVKARASAEVAAQQLAEYRAGPRKGEIEKAETQVARAEAQFAYADKNHANILKMARTGNATELEIQLAESELNRAKADVAWAKVTVSLLRSGTREEQVARAQAEVDLAKGEQARLEALRQKYALRAAHAGIVTLRKVNAGEVVAPGQVLLRIDSVEDLEIRAQVQESQLLGVKPGGPARVLADAYPDAPLEAVVGKTLPRVDPEQGTIAVLLTLTKPPPVVLMDGMAVDIALIGEEAKGVVRVPGEAIHGKGDAAYVWVRQGASFVRRPVAAGITDGYWVEVKSGLKRGQVVRLP
jgi:HlyD family secretion protein